MVFCREVTGVFMCIFGDKKRKARKTWMPFCLFIRLHHMRLCVSVCVRTCVCPSVLCLCVHPHAQIEYLPRLGWLH